MRRTKGRGVFWEWRSFCLLYLFGYNPDGALCGVLGVHMACWQPSRRGVLANSKNISHPICHRPYKPLMDSSKILESFALLSGLSLELGRRISCCEPERVRDISFILRKITLDVMGRARK